MVFDKQPLDAKRFCDGRCRLLRDVHIPADTGWCENSSYAAVYYVAICQIGGDKYFPGGDALGKTIRFDNEFDFEVSGVFEDVPANSHLQFTYVSSFITMGRCWRNVTTGRLNDSENLDAWNYSAYFYIPNAADPDELAKRMDQKLPRPAEINTMQNVTGDWRSRWKNSFTKESATM